MGPFKLAYKQIWELEVADFQIYISVRQLLNGIVILSKCSHNQSMYIFKKVHLTKIFTICQENLFADLKMTFHLKSWGFRPFGLNSLSERAKIALLARGQKKTKYVFKIYIFYIAAHISRIHCDWK